MRTLLAVGIGLALWCVGCAGSDTATGAERDARTADVQGVEPLTESQIRTLLAEFVDEDRQSVGVVAGTTSAEGRVVVGYGHLSADDPTQPDGDTVFEIGSITKVFTATVLADLVAQEELGLDTPVQSVLGDEVSMPTSDGAQITLGHLATHSSGLPRLPDNFDPADPTNPYADYTVEDLYAFLSSHKLARDIDEAVEYSNVGFGLLGHALSVGAGTDFEALIAERVLEPLQMSDTAIELTPALRERLATGHDGQLRPAANWDLPALAGAGALRSTVHDLLTFLEANLGLGPSPLRQAMERARTPQRSDPALGMDIGLGWIIAREGDREFVWHNGGTGGYASFVGFDAQAGEGIVILSNSALSVDNLAYRLFTRDFDE
ncbi:MAG: serine hydrolase [bacterium]|nr:serine hydrolase [bacterium]